MNSSIIIMLEEIINYGNGHGHNRRTEIFVQNRE
jgi:hypothetical protein